MQVKTAGNHFLIITGEDSCTLAYNYINVEDSLKPAYNYITVGDSWEPAHNNHCGRQLEASLKLSLWNINVVMTILSN